MVYDHMLVEVRLIVKKMCLCRSLIESVTIARSKMKYILCLKLTAANCQIDAAAMWPDKFGAYKKRTALILSSNFKRMGEN